MRTLHLTSPHMKGADVQRLQAELRHHKWYTGHTDGEYGPLTAQAVHRAKYWLGYRKPDQVAGDLLMAYMTGHKKQSLLMRARTKRRMRKPAVPRRIKRYNLAVTQIGVKEHPPGTNRVKYSQWYCEIGPWCAMFASWCDHFVGGKFHYDYVPSVVADAHLGRNGLALTASPLRGDYVCYDWQGDRTADHIGIFEGWVQQGVSFTAIEGNTSSDEHGDQSNGGEVCRKTRTVNLVQVFVHESE